MAEEAVTKHMARPGRLQRVSPLLTGLPPSGFPLPRSHVMELQLGRKAESNPTECKQGREVIKSY